MRIWPRVREILLGWRSRPVGTATAEPGSAHLELARESLRELIEDPRVPSAIRAALAEDYAAVRRMLDKLEHGHVHIVVFGRVGVGKSALLNALLGTEAFATSPLHGETRQTAIAELQEYDAGGVFLIDTPGIDEVGGEAREAVAHEAAARADLLLFVVDADLSAGELTALRSIKASGRPVLLVLNKRDRYSSDELQMLRSALLQRTSGLIEARDLIVVAARPAERSYVVVDEAGREREERRAATSDVTALRTRLWQILEAEGKTLAALNASLFASDLSEQVAQRILETRRRLADSVIHTWCLAKGVAVALNPVPVTDLAAAALIDISMITHLSRLHGLPLSRAEAGGLVGTVIAQLAALMGTVWVVHLVSAALKLGSGGLSTVLTAGTQGAVAYYSTYVVGRVAERYLAQGRSWGEGGPKRIVQDILDSVDRDSILAEARAEILARLRADRRKTPAVDK